MTALVEWRPEDVKMFPWSPQGIGADPPSTSVRNVTFKIKGTEQVMTLPLYTCTKVHEVMSMFEFKFDIEPGSLQFFYKQGCSMKKLSLHEEVTRHVLISGLKLFGREKHKYEHPHAVIGAGHMGIKQAMEWLRQKEPETNFIIWDRREEVGGTSWYEQANRTSRLQTEVGAYHIQFHPESDWPADSETDPWPSRDKLLVHMVEQAAKHGVLPYCRMNSNVTVMDIIESKPKDYMKQTYMLTVEDWIKDKKKKVSPPDTLQVSSICFFPGNLTLPKRVTYPGEAEFGGDVVYGISCNFDYNKVRGNEVCIVGSGAFAVENVRTCLEHHVHMIHMVCRRKTISMPRFVSWLINQSDTFISAGLTLEASFPMYSLINKDVWDYYAVISNQARTTVTIKQASRFGIGDAYFLAMYYEKCDHRIDDIKRVSHKKIHLVSGDVIEDVSAMLKLLGFWGEFNNDRLMKAKELYGFWVNRDHRRFMVAEPIGVDAQNFGGTSFSPGALMWAEWHIHLLNYPKDWLALREGGGLPIHLEEPEKNRPIYVVDARHGSTTIVMVNNIPDIAEKDAARGNFAGRRQRECHPMAGFILAAKKEWDAYCDQFEKEGWRPDIPRPAYPYSLETAQHYLDKATEEFEKFQERMARVG